MALNNTTLTYAISNFATEFDVGATTNITPPVETTGSATYLFMDGEMMLVSDVPVSKHVRDRKGATVEVDTPAGGKAYTVRKVEWRAA